MYKDFVITAMNVANSKEIHLVKALNHGYQFTREDALDTAKKLAVKFPDVSYMVMSLRGCRPHEVVVKTGLHVEGLE